MAKLTCEEFNKRWDKSTYDAMEQSTDYREHRKYLTDCYNMYETGGFCKTFRTPYFEYSQYNGHKYKKLRRAKMSDGFNWEDLPAWYIEFEDGVHIFAFPEEICKIGRENLGIVA